MLARLQLTLVLGLSVVVLLYLGAVWWQGWPVWAAAGVLIAPAGYAAVLALEFGLMHRVNRDDLAPRASRRQVVRAWWSECLAGPRVFGWRQPLLSARWRDRLSQEAGRPALRGVLFVHGFVCNRGLWNPWLRALTRAKVPFLAVNLEPIFGSIEDYVPIIERAVARLEVATGQSPIVVAHSMGGLALRRWWVEPGNAARVHRAITLGTPHHGTWLARYAVSANGRQMQREGDWLRRLAEREPPDRAQRFVCFYSHCDNIVFPGSTAMLAGADNRHLPAVAHVDMADQPEPRQELWRLLGL